MIVLFLQIFFVLFMVTASIAGAVALEVYLAAALRSHWDRAARKRHYILYVLFRLRGLAAQPPSLQKEGFIALYNEGVLNVYPEGFATYQALFHWFYRQLDYQGRQMTLSRPTTRRTSRVSLVQPQTA